MANVAKTPSDLAMFHRYRAVKPHRAATREELSLRVGDIVLRLRDCEGGRWFGRNQNDDGIEGEFDPSCVESASASLSGSWSVSEDDSPVLTQPGRRSSDSRAASVDPKPKKTSKSSKSLKKSSSSSLTRTKLSQSGDTAKAKRRDKLAKIDTSPQRPSVVHFQAGATVICTKEFIQMDLDELSLGLGDEVTLIERRGTRWKGANTHNEIGWFDEECIAEIASKKASPKKKSSKKSKKSTLKIPASTSSATVPIAKPGMRVVAISEFTAEDMDGLNIAVGDSIKLMDSLGHGLWRGENQHGEIGVFPLVHCSEGRVSTSDSDSGSVKSGKSGKSTSKDSQSSKSKARSRLSQSSLTRGSKDSSSLSRASKDSRPSRDLTKRSKSFHGDEE